MTLFRREFIVPQDTLAWVLASHAELEDPERFVWLRAFADRTSRACALEQFYHWLAWQAHRQADNDTMRESDNVLLLKPMRALSSGALGRRRLLRVAIHYLDAVPAEAFAEFFGATLLPLIQR